METKTALKENATGTTFIDRAVTLCDQNLNCNESRSMRGFAIAEGWPPIPPGR